MTVLSPGVLARTNGKGPTDDHEKKIDDYVSQGFSRYGFSMFFKVAILNDVSTHKIDLVSAYEEIKGKQQKDVFGGRLKRSIAKQLSCIPDIVENTDYDPEIDEPQSQFRKNDIWFDGWSMAVDDFMLRMAKELRVLPDCWRVSGDGYFELVEVKDSSEVPFSKLMKLAEMDEMLFGVYGNKCRIRLKEYYIDGGVTIKHDLCAVWDYMEMMPHLDEQRGEKQLRRDYMKLLQA